MSYKSVPCGSIDSPTASPSTSVAHRLVMRHQRNEEEAGHRVRTTGQNVRRESHVLVMFLFRPNILVVSKGAGIYDVLG